MKKKQKGFAFLSKEGKKSDKEFFQRLKAQDKEVLKRWGK